MRYVEVFDSGSPMVFDGNEAQYFVVRMRNSVTTSRVKNLAPGGLYVFQFIQDAIGNHNFTPPPEIVNFGMANPAPYGVTTQVFVATDGKLLPIGGATWTGGTP